MMERNVDVTGLNEMLDIHGPSIIVFEDSDQIQNGFRCGFDFINSDPKWKREVTKRGGQRRALSLKEHNSSEFMREVSRQVCLKKNTGNKFAFGLKHTDKAREAISKNNGRRGKFWITDGVRSVLSTNSIPEGWRKGRVMSV